MRPSLLIIPANETPGVLMPQIPFNGTADFTVSRTTTPANNSTRVNSSGLIEIVNNNVPRIDYLNQSCPGLLVEPSAQNLFQRSEEFNNAYWTKANCVVLGNLAIAPDGNLTADKLIMNNGILPNAANQSGFTRSETITSGTYRFSVFAKAAEFTGFRVRENVVQGTFLDVNLTNGAITNGDVTQFINPLAENYGNGWYRISWTSPTITSLTKYSIRVGSTGDGTSGIFVWGAQVETGSIATSYIPTTTTTASRAADSIIASGALVSGLIGQTEGTIYAEVDVRNWQNEGTTISITVDGSQDNSIRMYSLSVNQFVGLVRTAGQNVAVLATSTGLANGVYKMALAYKANDFAFYVNGSLVNTDTSGTPPACNFVLLGQEGTPLNTRLNDRIRAAAIYTTRLSNDDLIRLTLPSTYVTYNDMALGLAYTIK